MVVALQALYVFAPFMQEVFGSAALDAEQLAWATAAAVTVLPVAGAEEWLRRRSAREQRR